MSTDSAQQMGFAKEAVEGTDPINAIGAKYWLHGINTTEFNNLHAVETHLWRPIYGGGSLMPREQELISTQIGALNFGFVPTNMIAFYHALGKATSPATPVIIEAMAPGSSLPSFTQRSESTGGTVDKIFSAVGCKIHRLDGFYTLFRAVPTLTLSIVYSGIQNTAPSYNDIHNGAEHPTSEGTMGGTQVANTRYKRDSNFECSWDVDGSNDDYKNELLSFSFSIINTSFLELIHGQKMPTGLKEGLYRVETGLQILRGADKSIYTDYLAKTQHDLRFKIYAGATNYLQLDFDNVALGRCSPNIKIGKEEYMYDFHGSADGIVITGVDSINQAEYYDI